MEIDHQKHMVSAEQKIVEGYNGPFRQTQYRPVVFCDYFQIVDEPVEVVVSVADSTKITVPQEIIHAVAIDFAGHQLMEKGKVIDAIHGEVGGVWGTALNQAGNLFFLNAVALFDSLEGRSQGTVADGLDGVIFMGGLAVLTERLSGDFQFRNIGHDGFGGVAQRGVSDVVEQTGQFEGVFDALEVIAWRDMPE